MKVFQIIGLHHSGKTTAVERLIKYIRGKGSSVSSIKDIHIENFTMEKKGSNSDRHLTASNTCVFARGTNETYLIWKRQLPLKEMLNHLITDWVVIEGMKEVNLPKIIAAKDEEEINLLFDDTVFAITGPVSENITSYKGIPIINAINNISDLGELVLNKVFEILPFANNGFCGHCGYNCYEMTAMILKDEKTREDCGIKKTQKINISFNDKDINLNEWVETISIDLINALCKNLKGYKKGDKINITIE